MIAARKGEWRWEISLVDEMHHWTTGHITLLCLKNSATYSLYFDGFAGFYADQKRKNISRIVDTITLISVA